MNDFSFLSFHTEYSSEGTVEKRMGKEACFSRVFHGPYYMTNKYVIKIYSGFCMIKQHNNNGCFLTKEQLHRHVILLWKIWHFPFTIKEKISKNGLNPYFELSMQVTGYNIVHRFILTWIRYSYEFPYSLYMLDVIKLKRFKEFKYLNQFNIFNLVSSRMRRGEDIHMFTDVHYKYPFMKTGAIKHRLKYLGFAKETHVLNLFALGKEEHGFDQYDDMVSLDGWEENFKNRLLKYIDLYYNLK